MVKYFSHAECFKLPGKNSSKFRNPQVYHPISFRFDMNKVCTLGHEDLRQKCN